MSKQIATLLYTILVLIGLLCPLTSPMAAPIAQGSEGISCPPCFNKEPGGGCQASSVCGDAKKMSPDDGCKCVCRDNLPFPYHTNPSTCELECSTQACGTGQSRSLANNCECACTSDCSAESYKTAQDRDTCDCICPAEKPHWYDARCNKCPADEYFDGFVCKLIPRPTATSTRTPTATPTLTPLPTSTPTPTAPPRPPLNCKLGQTLIVSGGNAATPTREECPDGSAPYAIDDSRGVRLACCDIPADVLGSAPAVERSGTCGPNEIIVGAAGGEVPGAYGDAQILCRKLNAPRYQLGSDCKTACFYGSGSSGISGYSGPCVEPQQFFKNLSGPGAIISGPGGITFGSDAPAAYPGYGLTSKTSKYAGGTKVCPIIDTTTCAGPTYTARLNSYNGYANLNLPNPLPYNYMYDSAWCSKVQFP